jgi:hypothetical protein
VAQLHGPGARRELQHRAVLADDDVEAGEVAGQSVQFGEAAAGREHDEDAPASGIGDGVPHGGVEHAVIGDGAVVVQREGGEFHAGLFVVIARCLLTIPGDRTRGRGRCGLARSVDC